jgi:hypothetical protein
VSSDFSEFNISDFYTDLEEISKQIERHFEILGSLADNRKQHRDFAEQININFNTLDIAYKLYKPSIIISIYTFVEKLLKSYIYCTLGTENNEAITQFINLKIPKNRFAPNLRLDDISQSIREYTPNSNDFRLLIKMLKDEESEKNFNEMVSHRHRYAHRGVFEAEYDEDGFKNIINTLYYLTDELNFCFFSIQKRIELQKEIDTIYKRMAKVKKMNKHGFNKTIKEIRGIAKKVICLFKITKLEFKSEFYANIGKDLEVLTSIDLREKVSKNKDTLSGLKMFKY